MEAVYQSSKKGCCLSRSRDMRAVCLGGRLMGFEKTGSSSLWVTRIAIESFCSGKGCSDRMDIAVPQGRNVKFRFYYLCRSFCSDGCKSADVSKKCLQLLILPLAS